jgi:hypothetical protein
VDPLCTLTHGSLKNITINFSDFLAKRHLENGIHQLILKLIFISFKTNDYLKKVHLQLLLLTAEQLFSHPPPDQQI